MPNRFIGTWKLQDFRLKLSDQRADVYPFGTSAQGLLSYTNTGHMQAILSHEERSLFSISGLEQAHLVPHSEKVTAFNECLSYAGTYQVLSDRIIHRVEYALNPSIIGQDQIRYYQFLEPDKLLLYYQRQQSPELELHYQLQWIRISKCQ